MMKTFFKRWAWASLFGLGVLGLKFWLTEEMEFWQAFLCLTPSILFILWLYDLLKASKTLDINVRVKEKTDEFHTRDPR